MAAILGLDPFKNAHDVWLDKTGKLEAMEPNQAMVAGTFFEDGVLQFAEKELGPILRNQYRSARGRGIPLGANIDAILVNSGVPVEAKTAGLFGPLRDTWGEAGTDEVPDRVVIQATVHMICSETEMCHVVAFLAGRGFVAYVVNRDKVIADVVAETAISFWTDNVLADVPPDGTLPHAQSIKRIRREPESIVEVDQKLIDNWLTAKASLKEVEKVKDAAELELLTALGEAEGGLAELGLLTYLPQSRTSVDAKSLKADYPEIYDRYAKTSTYRVARWKLNK